MTLYNVIYHLKQMKQVRSLVFNSLCHNGNLMHCLVCKKQKARTFKDQCFSTEAVNQMSNQCHISVLERNLILSGSYKRNLLSTR